MRLSLGAAWGDQGAGSSSGRSREQRTWVQAGDRWRDVTSAADAGLFAFTFSQPVTPWDVLWGSWAEVRECRWLDLPSEGRPPRPEGTAATVEECVLIPHVACTAGSAGSIRVVPGSTEEGELSQRQQGWEGRDPVLTSAYCECQCAPCLLEAPGQGGRREARHSNRRDPGLIEPPSTYTSGN